MPILSKAPVIIARPGVVATPVAWAPIKLSRGADSVKRIRGVVYTSAAVFVAATEVVIAVVFGDEALQMAAERTSRTNNFVENMANIAKNLFQGDLKAAGWF
ncbi:hypothetical protein V5O48_013074 [Marasmius crinis-equi]|uniref:Uncharacterized protein n=1 Tax=Marasmius crinis-equi TaxID=585013 RepID=A0ABR3F1F4_9AGAR